jgi:hypothetical protein
MVFSVLRIIPFLKTKNIPLFLKKLKNAFQVEELHKTPTFEMCEF